MANEITVNSSIYASKNGATLSQSSSKTIDMSGDQMLANIQIVGTAAEAIVLGDVSTIGYLMLKNTDSTNYVEIAGEVGITNFVQKILAGEFILLKPEVATIYAKANTAAVNLLVVALEL